MQIRYSFDDDLLRENNVERKELYDTIKDHFSLEGIKCVSDDEMLIFEGSEETWANMWNAVIMQIQYDWFQKCVSSCVYADEEEGEEEEEDILAQMPKLLQMLGYMGNIENIARSERTLEKKYRKQILIGLDDQKLKEYYPCPETAFKKPYYKKAWDDIAEFLEKNNFERWQDHLYVSADTMTYAEAVIIVKNMQKELTWLGDCLEKFSLTNVSGITRITFNGEGGMEEQKIF